MEGLKQIIRNLGEVGIPVMGYNFSLAGVASRISGPFARGGAESVGMNGVDNTPIPNGMVWNMIWDRDVGAGVLPSISHETLWQRLDYFLSELVPVAEMVGRPPCCTPRRSTSAVRSPATTIDISAGYVSASGGSPAKPCKCTGVLLGVHWQR